MIDRAAVAGGLEELADLLTEPGGGTGRASSSATRSPPSGAVAGAVAAGRGARRAGARRSAPRPGGLPAAPPALEGACSTPAAAAHRRRVLGAYDRVLLVAEQAFMVYPYTPGPAVPPDVELLHLSPDPRQLGRAWPVRLGVAGDPRATPRGAAARSCGPGSTRAAAADARGAQARHGPWRRGRGARGHRARRATAPRRWTRWPPPTPWCGRCRPTPWWSTRRSPPACTSGASTTGPSPVATSSARAAGSAGACRPRAGSRSATTVLRCSAWSGDGSAMYSPQALWTAAAEGLPVVFAVVNNRQYKILKGYLRGMGGAAVRTGPLRRHGPRRPARRLRRPGALDGGRRHASSTTPATSATPCGPRWAPGGPHVLELPISA